MWRMLIAATVLTCPVSSFALGFVTMTSTPHPDSVVVHVTVDDQGDAPLCTWLAVTRQGQDVFYFQRVMGAVTTHRFVDTGVKPNTMYCYNMALRLIPGAVPCANFCDAFDCFCQVQTCANTGPEPALLGHGFLKSTYPDGWPVDDNETRAILYPCSNPDAYLPLHSIPEDAAQYMDRNVEVEVRGGPWCCWAQCVWLLVAQQVTPKSCVISVESATWGRVKAMYRD